MAKYGWGLSVELEQESDEDYEVHVHCSCGAECQMSLYNLFEATDGGELQCMMCGVGIDVSATLDAAGEW